MPNPRPRAPSSMWFSRIVGRGNWLNFQRSERIASGARGERTTEPLALPLSLLLSVVGWTESSFETLSWPGRLHDYRDAVEVDVGLAQCGDGARTAALDRSDVDEQHLVFEVMDHAR